MLLGLLILSGLAADCAAVLQVPSTARWRVGGLSRCGTLPWFGKLAEAFVSPGFDRPRAFGGILRLAAAVWVDVAFGACSRVIDQEILEMVRTSYESRLSILQKFVVESMPSSEKPSLR